MKSGNTSNLLAHLCNHHADLYAESSKGIQSKDESSKQPSLRETPERSIFQPLATTLNMTHCHAKAICQSHDMLQPVCPRNRSMYIFPL